MAKIARAVALVVLVIASLGSAGCLHTLMYSFQDYPPSAQDPGYTKHQGDPRDG
jgi:hypothetical protein